MDPLTPVVTRLSTPSRGHSRYPLFGSESAVAGIAGIFPPRYIRSPCVGPNLGAMRAASAEPLTGISRARASRPDSLIDRTWRVFAHGRAEFATTSAGNPRRTYCVRLVPEFADCIDAYAADHGMTRSDALRDLVIAGLEARGY